MTITLNGTTGIATPAIESTIVELITWTITESGGVLYFAANGVNKAKLDSSGNLTVVGDITAYGTV